MPSLNGCARYVAERGVTFVPSVSEDGIISWTNDGGRPNPEPVDIRGPAGAGRRLHRAGRGQSIIDMAAIRYLRREHMAKQYMSESDLQLLVSLITGELKGKVDTETGKGLSTNDYTNEDKSKLAGIAPNATANSTDTYLLARENHTGTQSADTIVDGTANKVLTKALHDKLSALYQDRDRRQPDQHGDRPCAQRKAGPELKALIDAINTDIGELGAGDMLKSVYDVDGDGVVDSAANSAKLGGQLPSHYENVLTAIKVNGTVQTITDKGVDIAVPTNNNQLTNGAGYQTASQVESAITGKGYQTAAQVESAITGKGYQTAPQVAAAISAAGPPQAPEGGCAAGCGRGRCADDIPGCRPKRAIRATYTTSSW